MKAYFAFLNIFLSFQDRFRHLFEQLFFSNLIRRIVIFNLTALCVLVVCIMYLNQFRDSLIESKMESLKIQGTIIAGAIAASIIESESAFIPRKKITKELIEKNKNYNEKKTNDSDFLIDPERISPLLQHLISPATTHARVYDRNANLLLDSRLLYSSGQVFSYILPPILEENSGWFERWKQWFFSKMYVYNLPLEKEDKVIVYPEIIDAISGTASTAQRRNLQGELVVSVAVPIQSYHAVMGVLLLSTEGRDIDNIVQEEQQAIFNIFAVVAVVMIVLSFFLAFTIASPLRKLAAAAEQVRYGMNKRIEIPDYSFRRDEIAHLSVSLRTMTDALYTRIEAIERFAADVSHELKNPLTSLRSAVETLPLIIKRDDLRQRLLGVIRHDVCRLDRLITDIAEASRLDAELVREDSDLVDLEQLLKKQIIAVQEICKGKKYIKDICLETKLPFDNKNYFVRGHDLRLEQVFSNLIENACSFIPEEGGKIFISMMHKEKHIIISIEDNGPGICAENIDRIFERFYTDRPKSEDFGLHSGLGLSISRHIVQAHGGELKAENIPSKTPSKQWVGARFLVILPIANQE